MFYCTFCGEDATFALVSLGDPSAGEMSAYYCLRHLAIKGEQIRRALRREKLEVRDAL